MFFLKLISRLPFTALYVVADFLFLLSYHVIRYRRGLVRKNLKLSFPHLSKPELKRIERAFYLNLCDYAVETLKLLTVSRTELKERMVFTNPEMLNEYTEKGQSIILLSSHQFNWEWLLVSGKLWLTIPIDFVYQPIKNKFVDTLMQTCRKRFGGYAIKRDEVARELVKRKSILRGVAIVADQYPGHKQNKKFETTFLNQATVFFYGSQQMANLTQYPVLYGSVKKRKTRILHLYAGKGC
ncbi:lysophospholipid acyltransferase family protein [Oscillatoria amoena NRMC-F 0135]|nr:lysophospholipid acyltransferase family protein [Oscillatoria amoena NRMC-F 0135]